MTKADDETVDQFIVRFGQKDNSSEWEAKRPTTSHWLVYWCADLQFERRLNLLTWDELISQARNMEDDLFDFEAKAQRREGI